MMELNSWLTQKTPLGKSRFFRLTWIQLFKPNPLNLSLIWNKKYNQKLGRLIGYCNLYTKTNKRVL